MKTTSISLLVVAALVFSTAMAIGIDKDGLTPQYTYKPSGDTRDYTHTVMVEVGTGSWCYWCQFTNAVMHAIYTSGNYDFEYVELVEDKNPVAHARVVNDYNIAGYPTSFFDGGYEVVVGGYSDWGTYTSKMNTSGARTVPNIAAGLTVGWLGNNKISVSADIDNNGAAMYAGHVRAFVTEITSRWNDYAGQPYHHGFLGFAINQDITIPSGGTYQASVTWDAAAAGYPGITQNNVQVVLAVYNATGHLKYADPPSGNPFTAHYVDETVAAIPTTDSTPPVIANVQATPQSQTPGGTVNITATVTDNTAVDTVEVTITPPGGTAVTYPMTKQGSTSTYYYQSTYTTLGTYNFYISADDTFGNDATSPTYNFVIEEFTPPVIQTVTATPVLGGNTVNVTCMVTDNVEVDSVKLYMTSPTGGQSTIGMINIPSTDYYYYTTSYPLIGDYNFYILARDTSGNNATSGDWVIMREQIYTGWNLITVPVGNSWTAETLGQKITGCSVVIMFDAQTQIFTTHVVGTPWDDFPIENGVGYYCYMGTGSVFVSTGPSIESASVSLYTGWNIIGWYQEYDTAAESVGDNIIGCTVVSMFDAETQIFISHVVGTPSDNFLVERGMGLFIYTNQPSTWYGGG